jgi:hypothetical protein
MHQVFMQAPLKKARKSKKSHKTKPLLKENRHKTKVDHQRFPAFLGYIELPVGVKEPLPGTVCPGTELYIFAAWL